MEKKILNFEKKKNIYIYIDGCKNKGLTFLFHFFSVDSHLTNKASRVSMNVL